MATWVVGDIHGCFDDFMKILNHKEVKKNDNFILIGDIIDRGPDSYKMLKWAMENVTDDGKYQMILGNHEDNIIHEYINALIFYGKNSDISHLYCMYGFEIYMHEAGFERLSSIKPIIDWFGSLPLYKKVSVNTNSIKQDYIIAHAWYNKNRDRNTLLWDRDIDKNDFLTNDYEPINKEILIHGHTPTISIRECIKEPVNQVLFREHSINIDCGAVFSQYGGNLAAIRLEDKKTIYANEQRKIIICYE